MHFPPNKGKPMLPEFADPKKQITAHFELHPVKNDAKTKTAGRPVYDDMEVCVIRIAGNRSTKGVFPAHEVFTHQMNPETGEREPVTYAMHYNEQYRQFKNGDAQSMSGTPVTALPLITPAKRMELKALGIHSVETLAGIDGAQLKSLGMGGRDLKNQAIAYLEQAAKLTDTTNQREEIEALKARIAELETGKSSAPASVPNPFADWEVDDLRNWLKDNAPDQALDMRWGKTKLQELAADVNAKLKAAA
jgi:hypothetical protein